MPTDAQMRAMLEENGAKVRNTANAEYWYHRRWWQGLPLGLAFMEMEREVRRNRARLAELHAIKKAGWKRCKNAEPHAWVHPSHPGRYGRREAFALLAREVQEHFNDVANGRD